MKFARVNLEPESFGDPRFAHLARLLGMPGGDGHFALIKVALIWSWQTEHYTPDAPCFHVPEDVVEMALGVDGPAGCAALVRARLAEETPDGLRMRGSSHERTGWLWRIRNKAQAGGHAKAESAKRKRANESLPEVGSKHAQGMPRETPLSSLISVPEDHTHTPRAREASPPEPVTDATAGSDQDIPGKPDEPRRPVDRVLVLAERFRSEVDAARRALLVELGAPFPPSRTTDAAVLSMAMAVVAGWCASEPDKDPEAIVAARSAHLLANRLAMARDRKRADWWAPSTFWDPDGIGKDLEHRTPADAVAAMRARAGPRDGQPRRPASPTRGQAPAIVSSNRPDGEIPL